MIKKHFRPFNKALYRNYNQIVAKIKITRLNIYWIIKISLKRYYTLMTT